MNGRLGWWRRRATTALETAQLYDDCLASIDPLGQVKEMVALHERTIRRKGSSKSQIQRAWNGVSELMELAAMEDWEDRWRYLAALAKATAGAPDLTKHCLNKTLLARLREKRLGKVFQKDFTNEDFKRAAKLAGELSGTQWQEETYAGLRDLNLNLNLCRGVFVSAKRHPGRQDVARIQTMPPSLGITGTSDNLAAASAASAASPHC